MTASERERYWLKLQSLKKEWQRLNEYQRTSPDQAATVSGPSQGGLSGIRQELQAATAEGTISRPGIDGRALFPHGWNDINEFIDLILSARRAQLPARLGAER